MPYLKKKVRLVNPSKHRRRNAPKPWSAIYQAHYHGKKRRRNPHRRRRRNEVVMNPRRRRRRNEAVYLLNPRRRRRNPFGLNVSEKMKQVLGIIGGASVTKLITDRLPFNLNTGPIGYLSSAAVSMILGYGVGRFSKDRELGDSVTLGGFTYVVLRVLEDFVPSIAGVSAVGLRGNVGAIMPSQGFAVPLVNQPGSMTKFVTPGFVSEAMPNQLQGLNAGRRLARVR